MEIEVFALKAWISLEDSTITKVRTGEVVFGIKRTGDETFDRSYYTSYNGRKRIRVYHKTKGWAWLREDKCVPTGDTWGETATNESSVLLAIKRVIRDEY